MTSNQHAQLIQVATNTKTAWRLIKLIESSTKLSKFLLDVYFLACETVARTDRKPTESLSAIADR